jgi:hypothetical protein
LNALRQRLHGRDGPSPQSELPRSSRNYPRPKRTFIIAHGTRAVSRPARSGCRGPAIQAGRLPPRSLVSSERIQPRRCHPILLTGPRNGALTPY